MRLGAVPYLNALPLIFHLPERPRLAPPAVLERLLKIGEVDLATAPITTLLQNPDFNIVPGIAIATQGAVRSVRLILRKPAMSLADVRSIYLDMESRTSVLLLKVLLKFKYHLDLDRIQFITPIPQPDVDAVLLIGDKALKVMDGVGGSGRAPARAQFTEHGWAEPETGPTPLQLDLGQEWTSWTELPFVFAAWISNKSMIDTKWISLLQEARDRALSDFAPLLDSVEKFPRDFAADYLKNNLSYDLGKREIEGIERFHGYLKEMGLVGGEFNLRFY